MRRSFLFLLSSSVLLTSWSAAADGEAKSAILFIGDGMGLTQVTAARIFQGNARDGKLSLDTFEHTAIVRTYSENGMVTDSGAAATAFSTGYKTTNLRIGMSADGKPLENIFEAAKRAGKSVGIVTTTSVTHATPASFFAHVPNRTDENAIAAQFLDSADVDVLMGGGRRYFLPRSVKDHESDRPGSRRDDRNLIKEASDAGYRVIQRLSEFDQLLKEVNGGAATDRVLGLFNPGHMQYSADRTKDSWGEPTIEAMTTLAIKVLERNPNGFVLMVEGGRIDHGGHDNKAHLALTDLIAFDTAIGTAREIRSSAKDTLLVVSADHETGGMSINGYGPIEIQGDALFSTKVQAGGEDIITFATGPGAKRPDGDVDKKAAHYRQPAIVQGASATHTATDVIAWASGPGADAFHGTINNSDVGTKLFRALGFNHD